MYVEQRLTDCEVCCRTLALQYHWDGSRPPTGTKERVTERAFHCPACRHVNVFLTLMYAYDFELKAIPGIEPDPRVHPNSWRRLQLASDAHRREQASAAVASRPRRAPARPSSPHERSVLHDRLLRLARLWPFAFWLGLLFWLTAAQLRAVTSSR